MKIETALETPRKIPFYFYHSKHGQRSKSMSGNKKKVWKQHPSKSDIPL